MFIVDVDGRKLEAGGSTRRVILLEAWSVPVAFYDEVWKIVPEFLSKGQVQLVGGLYGVSGIIDPQGLVILHLIPAWVPLSKVETEELQQRIAKAVSGLAGRVPMDVLLP
jgi:hypothetical protein